MGRIWPVAAALVLAGLTLRDRSQEIGDTRRVLPQLRVFVPLWFSFYGICALLALGGLLVSFSRGAWIGALVAALVLWAGLSGDGRFGRRLLLPLAVLSTLGLLISVAATSLGIERLNPLGESGAIRLKTWASALAMLRDHAIFGIGLDQFARLYPAYIDPTLLGTNEVNTAHPHNLVLDIWLRMGLIGLVAFAWMLWRFFRTGIAVVSEPTSLARVLRIGLIAAMAAALVHGLVDQFYFWPDIAFAFWLFLVVGRARWQG
jgi:O-antigen ligase